MDPIRTLIVEDSSSLRSMLEILARERGHEVRSAASAELGLKMFLESPADLLLLDWMLPGMSGVDLTRTIRGTRHGGNPVIVVLTGRSDAADLNELLDAGANDYLAKPFKSQLFSTRLTIAERQVEETRRRRTAEESFVQSEETFRSLTDASPDGILVRRGQSIVYSNPAMALYLGHPDTDALSELSYENIRLGEEESGARRFQRKDGSEVVAEVRSLPIVFEGRPATLEFVRDLTERRRMRSRAQLADRMASVGTLASGVAHEINNPLALVMANLGLIEEALESAQQSGFPDAELESKLHPLVTESRHGATRVAAIVRDLKTFARAVDDNKGPVDLRSVIASSVNVAYNQVRHSAQLIRDLQPTPMVEVNESRVGQVVVNLLLNAAQAMPDGGAERNRVTITTGTDEEGWAVIGVADTGAGIDDITLKRIYDPFFTTKTHATGLGLSICHSIVNAAGGEITVDTQLGKGTTFRLRFPAAARSSIVEGVSTKRIRRFAATSAKILVVDDEPLIGRSIKRALAKHDVTVVTRGEEALDLLRTESFDLVFCDLMMPSMTGPELFEQAQNLGNNADRRFVFMTGGAFTPSARVFLDKVENPSFEKPFEVDEVRQLVGRVLAGFDSLDPPARNSEHN